MLSQLARDSLAAFSQAWPAFALVAGLLLVGAAAAREGVFAGAGALVARAPVGPGVLLVTLLGVEALAAAVLNLDTAVVFMTPVLLHAARRRGIPEEPFLYGAVFVANSASLLLPGSNLTNLIVLSHDPVAGSSFAVRLAPAWTVAVGLTIGFTAVAFRRTLVGGGNQSDGSGVGFCLGAGGAGVAVAATLVLMLAQPALPVLGLGVAVVVAARLRPREALAAANPALLLAVLGVAVLLGTAGRVIGPIPALVGASGPWESAWLAAGAAIVANNLPAAAVFSSHAATHPRALLLGLDLGPNLAVTGSLSGLLWLRIARANGGRPSALRYSLLGLALVPLTLTAALLVTAA